MPNCAIDTIFEHPYKPACPLYAVASNRKELMSSSSCLYVADGAPTVFLVCKRQRRELALKGIGILQTGENCSIQRDKEGDFTLHDDDAAGE